LKDSGEVKLSNPGSNLKSQTAEGFRSEKAKEIAVFRPQKATFAGNPPQELPGGA
jgi:hypothetical protein